MWHRAPYTRGKSASKHAHSQTGTSILSLQSAVLEPNEEERDQRQRVIASIRTSIESDTQIRLPDYDKTYSRPAVSALASVGVEPNPYGGQVGPFRYQFEGEEDLLHLIVTRQDGSEIAPEEGQGVARFLLPTLPAALIWIRPGEYSQHFYCGHDNLLAHVPE
jgi:hypothetical protein